MADIFDDLNQIYLSSDSVDITDPLFGDLNKQYFDEPITLSNYGVGARIADIGKAGLRLPEHLAGTVGKVMKFVADYDTSEETGIAKINIPGPSGWIDRPLNSLMDKIRPEWSKQVERSFRQVLRTHGNKIADYWTNAALSGIEAPSEYLQMAREQEWYRAPVTRALTAVADSGGPFLSSAAITLITKNPQIGLVLLGGMSAADTYDELTDAGVDRGIAQNISLLTGTFEAVTETIPFNSLLGNQGVSLLKRFIKTGTLESLQEFIQNTGENYFKNFGYKYDPDDPSSVPDALKIEWGQLMNGWFESITAGFLMGGAATLGAGGSSSSQFSKQAKQNIFNLQDEISPVSAYNDALSEVSNTLNDYEASSALEDEVARNLVREGQEIPVSSAQSADEMKLIPDEGIPDQEIVDKAYIKGFAAKLTSIRNNADNMLAGAGNIRQQLRSIDKDLTSVLTSYEDISNLIEQNPQVLAELKQVKDMLPEYNQAVRDFVQRHTTENLNRIKTIGDQIAALGDQYAERVSRQKIEIKPADEARDKLIQSMKAAVPARAETIKARKLEKAKRFGKHETLLDSESGKVAFYRARAALKGELPNIDFELPQNISSEEQFHLIEQIRTSEKMTALEKDNTFQALENLLRGKAPAPFQIKLLERIFGKEFAQEAARLERVSLETREKIWRTVKGIINMPHAMLASSDLSASGRQGFFAGVSHPLLWVGMTKAGARALLSDNYADFVDTQIRTNKYYESGQRAGLIIRDYGAVSSNKADRFQTDFLQRNPDISKLTGYKRILAEIFNLIPTVVTASERAYVTSLNKFRMDLYAHYAKQWEGIPKTTEAYKSLAALINHATGESQNKFINNNASIFNAAFFAPRWAVSRFELVGDLAFRTPEVRKIAAKMWTKYMATGVGALSLLALAGFDVEKDPRSTDFGKARWGNTRFDFWGGHAQIVRAISQLITGQKKSVTSKRIYEQNRLVTVGRFLESKLSPTAGLTVDLLRGETFIGEDVYGKNAHYTEQIYNRMAPLFMQDTIDAARYQGLNVAIPAAPVAFFGIGMQSYPIRPTQLANMQKDQIAQETFGKTWDETGPLAQKLLRLYHPEIDIYEQQAKFQRSQESRLQIDLGEQQEAGVKVMQSLPEDVQAEMERLFVSPGGLSRRVGQNWSLNDTKYKSYQNQTSDILSKSLSKIIHHYTWNKLTEDQQRELLEYVISGAKKSIRNRLIQEAKISDLQSIVGKANER